MRLTINVKKKSQVLTAVCFWIKAIESIHYKGDWAEWKVWKRSAGERLVAPLN